MKQLPCLALTALLMTSCARPEPIGETFNDRDTLLAVVPEGIQARDLRVSDRGRVVAYIARMADFRDYVVLGEHKSRPYDLV